jgi:hypothetical protein
VALSEAQCARALAGLHVEVGASRGDSAHQFQSLGRAGQNYRFVLAMLLNAASTIFSVLIWALLKPGPNASIKGVPVDGGANSNTLTFVPFS